MRIGFFTDRYFPQTDGVAVSVDLFAKQLRKQGHEVFIFCPQAPSGTKMAPETDVIRFRSIPSLWYEDYRDTFPWTTSHVRKVQAYNLDIIHIHTPAQIGILGMRIGLTNQLPIVSTYHTDLEEYFQIYKHLFWGLLPATFAGLLFLKDLSAVRKILTDFRRSFRPKQLNRQLVRNALNAFHDNCDLVIAPSQKMASMLESYGTHTPIEILPTGVDTSEQPDTSFDIRALAKIPPTSKVISYAGRTGEEKNIQLTIKAMAHIASKHSDYHMAVIGDGPYSPELKALTKQLGVENQVHYFGMQPHARVLAGLAQTDVFVLTSMTDTQSLVLNEASLMATPLVWCDDQISPVTINHETGSLAKPTITDVAQKILYILQHPTVQEKMGLAAHQAALKVTIQEQTTKLIAIYSQLLKELE